MIQNIKLIFQLIPVIYHVLKYNNPAMKIITLKSCNQINTTGATSGAGTANSSGTPQFTPSFLWGSCYPIFSLICMFCRSLFVLLYFSFFFVLSVLLRFTYFDSPFGSGRFSTLRSDSIHHFFRNACTKSGSLRFSQFSGC